MSACEPIETQKSSQNMILHTVVKETYTICLDHWKFTRLREYQLDLCSPIDWLVLEARLCEQDNLRTSYVYKLSTDANLRTRSEI